MTTRTLPPHTVTYDELKPGSLRNHFLVAMPGLADSSFAHSVTYICEHTEEGAMGVVINAPTSMQLSDIFAQMDMTNRSQYGERRIMSGGPVHQDRGFVVHTGGMNWQSTIQISESVYLTASKDIIASIADGSGPDEFLITLGYAGWGKGQLEDEIATNSWLTVPATPAVIFDTPIDQRWTAAARPLGVDVNLMSGVAGHS